MPSVVEFRGAVALLGRFPALAGLDLAVGDGELVLLQGPNGAGKTSLLRACAGLLAVTSGEASVLGHDLVADRKTVRRHVGMLGHANHLYADLQVRDHLDFRARAAGAGPAEVADAVARMEIPDRLLRVQTERLSAGQRRRVAIASLMLRRPRLWLLDEPHAGLDSTGRAAVDRLLIDAAAAGATVMFASHELERASSVATRSVTIQGGQVVKDSCAS
ncbi:MAG: heme ABC exporter ATP-binding subunit CcmA [Candidatus Poriferisodalaceae bacterium]|jgi:heme ABC exporter ATP-binding subunit CcmA